MKACGIVAEYNPFHTGHAYHLKEAKKASGADVMIVAMSGNFVQRGEPAIVDKWVRAKQALQQGADLVVMLPVQSLQAADYFAQEAVRLLGRAGCHALSFGTEEAIDFEQVAYQWLQNEKQLHQQMQQLTHIRGNDYPTKLAYVMRENERVVELKPNQMLGIAYVKAMLQQHLSFELYPILRRGARHHDEALNEHFSSATALRNQLINEHIHVEQLKSWLYNVEELSKQTYVTWENYWPFLKYELLRLTVEELTRLAHVEEGLAIRLKKASVECTTWIEFLQKVNAKNWTHVRVQRACLSVLLKLTKETMKQVPVAYQVLGFTEQGQRYMKGLNDFFKVQYARSKTELQEEYRIDTLYQLGSDSILEQNIQRAPIRVTHSIRGLSWDRFSCEKAVHRALFRGENNLMDKIPMGDIKKFDN